jgi:lipopolysaccharide export system permease protein
VVRFVASGTDGFSGVGQVKRLDRYLFRSSFFPALSAVILFVALVLVSGVLPSLRWVIGDRIEVGYLLGWILWQIPAYLVQVLPIAVLLTILVAVGQLASNQEVLATAAAGVAPERFLTPFLQLAAGAALLALLLNQFVLPVAADRTTNNWWHLTENNNGLWRLQGRDIPIDSYTLTFEGSRPPDELVQVRLARWDDGLSTNLLFAESARYGGHLLSLRQATQVQLDFDLAAEGASPVQATASQPQDLTIRLSRTLGELITQYSGGSYEDGRSLPQLYADANNGSFSLSDRRQAAALFHRKLAEPVANLVLVLLALPVAIIYIRSKLVGFGLALAVALAWYLLLTGGIYLAAQGVVQVWLGAWMANIVLGGLGLGLLLRLRYR